MPYREDCHCAGCDAPAIEPRTVPGQTGPGFPAEGGPPETEGWACKSCGAILCEDCSAKGDGLCFFCRDEEAEKDEEDEK